MDQTTLSDSLIEAVKAAASAALSQVSQGAVTHSTETVEQILTRAAKEQVERLDLPKLGEDVIHTAEESLTAKQRRMSALDKAREMSIHGAVREVLTMRKLSQVQNNTLKDLPFPHGSPVQLCMCSEETCEYVNVHERQLRDQPSRKKSVYVHWNKADKPKNCMIVKKPNNPELTQLLVTMSAWLKEEHGIHTVVEPPVYTELGESVPEHVHTYTTAEKLNLHAHIDFVVCLGGDGTVLWLSGLFPKAVPPVIAFAMGSMGFLTAFDAARFRSDITSFLGGRKTPLTLRMRVSCKIIRRNDSEQSPAEEFTALNEAVIDRGPSPFLTKLECYCDDEFVTTVQADGLIVGTPTGSTAYNLSAGGSMIHPNVPCLTFTPICPHTLSFRPVVFPDSANIMLEVPASARASAWVSFDGQYKRELLAGDKLLIKSSPFPVPVICLHDETHDWFRSCTNLLNWNVRLQQKGFEETRQAKKSNEMSTSSM